MKKHNAVPKRPCLCKDEMNLAEFPLAVIGTRPPLGIKTLSFSDEITDPSTDQRVRRQWTVTGSDLLGLPTSVDEEVLVGCLKLTKTYGMQLRKVPFTAYEFLEELHWARDGKSYRRLTESLDRWTGTTVLSNDAFWHKGKQKRVKDTFSLLDRWKLQDEEATYEGKQGWFIWGDFMWESLQSGNIRNLDFDFWIRLQSPISKRLFRLLDKRFYRRKEVPFPLKQLAFDKVGVSRKMHTGQVKATLSKAHAELEEKGFCKSNYVRRGRGDWEVVYTDLRQDQLPHKADHSDPLAEKLLERGIENAAELLTKYSRKRILSALENYDDRRAHGEHLGPGWLGSCIIRKSPFAFRKGYQSESERKAELTRKREAKQRQALRQEQQQCSATKQQALKDIRFRKFLAHLKAEGNFEEYLQESLHRGLFKAYYEKSVARGDSAEARMWELSAMRTRWEKLGRH
ncbi:replication initiator protein A [Bythopirellula goksoeyrii]|uniref:Replication initiator protein A n=1 Tax=Bythopirellula goksoeyrii TaxID=1400387 RepID=A0A5B9QPB5_9BACT|nr:replication initiator protein A [Bythopirellula goksoeyrii]QEG35833.1 Replication initiator protein A [Bythopirellula goksoeyrii]